MARYTGPKWRISRRENADVFGSEKWRKRQTIPGQHPVSRGRPSEYAVQFREKQKVKRTYGLLEKQFRLTYAKASKSKGNTGTRLMQLLEMRLDNVVFRMGLAKTRNQARQYVTHGHIKVNGKKLDIPSYSVNVGDSIDYSDRFAKSEPAKLQKADSKKQESPAWLDGGQVKSVPTRDMLDQSVREQLIIELYSR